MRRVRHDAAHRSGTRRVCVSADAVLGSFRDVAYAYRFGGAGHDLVVATLLDATGVRIADAFHSPRDIRVSRATALRWRRAQRDVRTAPWS